MLSIISQNWDKILPCTCTSRSECRTASILISEKQRSFKTSSKDPLHLGKAIYSLVFTVQWYQITAKHCWALTTQLSSDLKSNLIIFSDTNCFLSSAANAVIPQLENPVEENTRIRSQLALAYRLIDRLELNEGACNHLTAMAPAKNGKGQVMLVVPGVH